LDGDNLTWVVLGEKNGKIQLVSRKGSTGILPKGSYLTIENSETKFILRVDSSEQSEPYSPNPMVIDMNLNPLKQDQKCQNIINAYRVKNISNRDDGLIDYIYPQLEARRSTQDEINLALETKGVGPKVFISTVHSSENQLLIDEYGNYITATLPEDLFFYQMLICGKTGSGKTVAAKYLAQYFVEEIGGCVLAINVKDDDLLTMDKPSDTNNLNVLKEWKMLGKEPHGISNYKIYYPANTNISDYVRVNKDLTERITLDVKNIEPESLTGLLQGISDIGSQNLPNIFRYWQENKNEGKLENYPFTLSGFYSYLDDAYSEGGHKIKTLNSRGDQGEISLHPGTFNNIQRNLDFALDFFDNEGAKVINETNILHAGMMSVINVSGAKGIQFGSVLLRDLLKRIVQSKSTRKYTVPVLIIIDEVHQFYKSDSSKEALGDLDTICRTGRSHKIGVIFSSQNPSDIPKGLSSVINTKIFFKTELSTSKQLGVKISDEEINGLKPGFSYSIIHDMSSLNLIKFPLSYSGVIEGGD